MQLPRRRSRAILPSWSRAMTGVHNTDREIQTPPRADRRVRKCRRRPLCALDGWPRRAWPGTRSISVSVPQLRRIQATRSEQEQRERCGEMAEDAGQVIRRRTKRERAVVERVGQPLDRAVKIGSRRVRKKKMLKPFGDQAPASDQRIAQDQGGVIPDEAVAQRRRVASRKRRRQEQEWPGFFTKN